jgi:hypothetical protein
MLILDRLINEMEKTMGFWNGIKSFFCDDIEGASRPSISGSDDLSVTDDIYDSHGGFWNSVKNFFCADIKDTSRRSMSSSDDVSFWRYPKMTEVPHDDRDDDAFVNSNLFEGDVFETFTMSDSSDSIGSSFRDMD